MSKPVVLLIEDDQWLAESYADTLLPLCEIKIVSNAPAAMELLDSQSFDAVVADVMLEDGMVIDLLHELQTYSDTMLLPVVLCTSLAPAMSLNDLKSYGVMTLLDKAAVTPETLRVAVQQALHTSNT